MSEEIVEEQQEATTEAPKKSGRGIFRLVKAIAFISVIVIVQVVVASMLAPSPQDTARIAKELAAAAHGETAEEASEEGAHEGDKHAEDGEEHELHEVELGTYNITRFNPATNTTLAIDFELFGTVLAEDVTEFEHHFEASNARIREQVMMTMHAAQSSDLTDAGLGLIKRQILEKTNRALGQPMLKEVLISKFNFVER